MQIKPIPPNSKIQKIPVLRGVVGLFRQLKLGLNALMYSAEFFDIEEKDETPGATGQAGESESFGESGPSAKTAEPGKTEDSSGFEKFLEEKLGDKAKDVIITLSVVISLCFSVGLFILLPNLIASLFRFNKTISSGLLLSNLSEGIVRITIFLGYMALYQK